MVSNTCLCPLLFLRVLLESIDNIVVPKYILVKEKYYYYIFYITNISILCIFMVQFVSLNMHPSKYLVFENKLSIIF
jgi:hypothetical protein